MPTTVLSLPSSGARAYLLRGESASVLVDTGTAALAEHTLAACHHMAVKLILLTHAHYDHCQNAAYFSQELRCPVAVGRADAGLLAGKRRPVSGEGFFGGAFAWASNRAIRNQEIPPVEPAVFLEDGMSLAPYGIDGKAVALPGHTAGSMGVLLDSRELVAGDALFGLWEPGPPWCYEDKALAEKSLEKIQALRPRKVYTGHALRRKSEKAR